MDKNASYNVDIQFFGDLKVNPEDLSKYDWKKLNDREYIVSDGAKQHRVQVLSFDPKNKVLKMLIGEKPFSLKVQNKLDQLISSLGFEEGMKKGFKELTAPMPGLVLDVKLSVGDAVEPGDPMLVLEAMKMENIIKSPGSGIVKEICVSKDDTVNKNQVLIKME